MIGRGRWQVVVGIEVSFNEAVCRVVGSSAECQLSHVNLYVFIGVGLEQGGSAEESHSTLRHKVCWNLQGTKLASNVQDGPESISFSLDPKTLGDTLKVSEGSC
jgi:hypothetical protein